ncbi:MAG: type II toxin-antitoxin system RelE/ParE family toxin [Archangium sp.]
MRIVFVDEALRDLERFADHLEQHEVDDPPERVRALIDAIAVLERNPHIGRPASSKFRELIVGEGSWGYVVLYEVRLALSTVQILAIRHQREDGYKR